MGNAVTVFIFIEEAAYRCLSGQRVLHPVITLPKKSRDGIIEYTERFSKKGRILDLDKGGMIP